MELKKLLFIYDLLNFFFHRNLLQVSIYISIHINIFQTYKFLCQTDFTKRSIIPKIYILVAYIITNDLLVVILDLCSFRPIRTSYNEVIFLNTWRIQIKVYFSNVFLCIVYFDNKHLIWSYSSSNIFVLWIKLPLLSNFDGFISVFTFVFSRIKCAFSHVTKIK